MANVTHWFGGRMRRSPQVPDCQSVLPPTMPGAAKPLLRALVSLPQRNSALLSSPPFSPVPCPNALPEKEYSFTAK